MSAVETLLPEETEIGIMTMRDEIRRQVLATIRGLHQQAGGLSRIHRTHPALYAQARRAFGSWREAVAAAGLDYGHELHQSLRRGLLLRDQRRALWHALSRFLLEHPGADDAALAAARPELAGRVRRCWGGVAGALAWAEQSRVRGRVGGPGPDSAHAAADS
jgi:hypothetical protein